MDREKSSYRHSPPRSYRSRQFDDEDLGAPPLRSSGSYSGSRTLQSDHNDEADYSEHSIPLSRSTVAAQASEKQRKAARQELDSMLAERASLSKTISHITEQLEGLRNPTATSRLKRPAPTTIPSSDATDSKEEIGTETNKKPKLEENEEDPAHSQPQNEPTRRSAKQAFQNPLMQRLLVGTLHKSQKEIERDKSDKLRLAKAEQERKTEEKLEAESAARRKAQLESLESRLQETQQKLRLLSISIAQKQEEYQSALWDEHEQFLRGNWLITKTEPRLFYQYAKYDDKVQSEIEKQDANRSSLFPAKIVPARP